MIIIYYSFFFRLPWNFLIFKMTGKRAFKVWVRCLTVNKQMLGHKFPTKSLQFIYSLDACFKEHWCKKYVLSVSLPFLHQYIWWNRPIKFCRHKPNTWRHILAVVVYVLRHNLHIRRHFFAVGFFSKFRGLVWLFIDLLPAFVIVV